MGQGASGYLMTDARWTMVALFMWIFGLLSPSLCVLMLLSSSSVIDICLNFNLIPNSILPLAYCHSLWLLHINLWLYLLIRLQQGKKLY